MRKMWTKLSTTAALAFMLCLTGLVITGEAQAQRSGVEPAFNKCLEDCVELDEAACKHCCEKAFELEIWKCHMQLSHCESDCRTGRGFLVCRNRCESKMRSCGKEAKGAHICP
jgi:hypothetical protein